MKLGYGLKNRQQQKLTMSPERLQALSILQASRAELGEYIKEEMISNPALEAEGGFDERETFNGYEEIRKFTEEYGISSLEKHGSASSRELDYSRYAYNGESMYDYLVSQLHFAFSEEKDIQIGEFVIASIDNSGYMSLSTKEIAEMTGENEEDVKRILEKIRDFDPPGIAAADLRDCIRRQLRQCGKLDGMIDRIITYHLEDLAANRIENISKSIGISTEAVIKAAKLIKSIEPKPGRMFSAERHNTYIFPDVLVSKDMEGNLKVDTVRGGMPTLFLSPYYEQLLREKRDDGGLQEYLSEKIESAIRLIKSIEQRENTLKNVTEAILSRQREFFEKGDKYLKPMTLSNIAEDTCLAESTISRAVNGKYVQCHGGMYELKYFFSAGFVGENGEEISATSIKRFISEIVENEDSKKPKSDQKIAQELKENGIDISRRTVAKYREEMGILSSQLRKKY